MPAQYKEKYYASIVPFPLIFTDLLLTTALDQKSA